MKPKNMKPRTEFKMLETLKRLNLLGRIVRFTDSHHIHHAMNTNLTIAWQSVFENLRKIRVADRGL